MKKKLSKEGKAIFKKRLPHGYLRKLAKDLHLHYNTVCNFDNQLVIKAAEKELLNVKKRDAEKKREENKYLKSLGLK